VTLAAADGKLAGELAQAIASASFRPYHSTDVRGVEIGGATKNVLAIAAGIVIGRGFGASAAAALTTRGFAELVRFGKAYGAKPKTMTGLSGLGDLILTCSSPQSRRARQIGRRRFHRTGAAGNGAREKYRDADLSRGRGRAGRKTERGYSDRVAADAPDQVGRVT